MYNQRELDTWTVEFKVQGLGKTITAPASSCGVSSFLIQQGRGSSVFLRPHTRFTKQLCGLMFHYLHAFALSMNPARAVASIDVASYLHFS
jgi:hypothetical protein